MELQQAITQIQQSHEQHSSMTMRQSNALGISKRLLTSEIVNEVSGLDLIPSKEVDTDTFAKAIALLQANYGTEYRTEKQHYCLI